MGSTGRYLVDVVVVGLSALTVVIALALLRPRDQLRRRWIPLTAAWLGAAMLTVRGVAG